MKKIITTLTAMTFVLGLTVAAPAQVAKTPEKPAVGSTQTAPAPAAAKEAAQPLVKETAKPGEKAAEAAKPVEKGAVKKEAKKAGKKAAKKAAPCKKGDAPAAPLKEEPK